MKKIFFIVIIIISLISYSNLLKAQMQIEFEIKRNSTCNNGCKLGNFYINGQLMGKTLELPWSNNRSKISCIPTGNYFGKVRQDGNRGWRIQLDGVPNRKYVQIHVGNYSHQIEGCILVGEYHKGCSVMKSSSVISKMKSLYNISFNLSQATLSGVNAITILVTIR